MLGNVSLHHDGQIRQLIIERLSRPNPQPVAISFCADVLDHADYHGRLPGTATKGISCKDSDAHAAALAGMRVNSKTAKCQFLVRNSWGTDCHQYKVVANLDCVDGEVWVNADLLSDNVFTVTYLDE